MLAVALTVGVALRLGEYFHEHALFGDEAALALNLAQRSMAELLSPLDHHQAAPAGFLVIVKLTLLALGHGELALRLVPLLAGIASLPLMYRVAKDLLGREQALVAVTLLAINTPAIIYATEFKQYGTDLLVSLVLLALVARWHPALTTWRRSIPILLAGAVAVWLSHPSAFMLAAIGTVALLDVAGTRNPRLMGIVFGAGLCWIASFAANYLVVTAASMQDEQLITFWSGRFMPFPPDSPSDLYWLYDRGLKLFKHPAGFKHVPWLGLAFALAGCALLARRKLRVALLCALPIVIALGASALHRYPFEGRFLLFALPGVLLLVSEGVWQSLRLTANLGVIVPALVLAIVVSGPLMLLAQDSRWPSQREELRAVLGMIDDRWRDGDRLLVHRYASFAYRYYRRLRPELWGRALPQPDAYFSGRRDLAQALNRVGDGAAQGRLWVVISGVAARADRYNEQSLAGTKYLDAHLATRRARGAAVHVFALQWREGRAGGIDVHLPFVARRGPAGRQPVAARGRALHAAGIRGMSFSWHVPRHLDLSYRGAMTDAPSPVAGPLTRAAGVRRQSRLARGDAAGVPLTTLRPDSVHHAAGKPGSRDR